MYVRLPNGTLLNAAYIVAVTAAEELPNGRARIHITISGQPKSLAVDGSPSDTKALFESIKNALDQLTP